MEKLQKVKTALLSMQRHSWEQGVAMQAFLEAGDDHIVIPMAREAAYRQIEDGRLAVIGTLEATTDPCAVGEALLYSIEKTKNPALIAASEKLLSWTLHKAPRNQEGILYHVINGDEFWVDSMYMLPPYLAAAGYYDEAMKQIRGYWQALYDPEKKLLSHRWDDTAKAFIRKDFWGVGNGWTLAALARVIDLLPAEMKNEKAELIAYAKVLLTSVAQYITPEGLAHDVLDQEETFLEVNFPQMLAYTIYRGLYSGWLDGKWKALADRCRRAAQEKVDEDGFVQDVCGAPHFISPGIAPEGQAFYILMESAARKLEE